MKFVILIFLLFQESVFAAATRSTECSEMEFWNAATAMCEAKPMADMNMIMFQGNAFFTQVEQSAPRGRDAFAIPNMFMLDAGHSWGENQYLNVDFMGTVEKWTYPSQGYPELFQIGENNPQGQPYLDAQHPHSSPIMGLTFSDTVIIGSDLVKVFFAPRGESTDGPTPFMHRLTGTVNPDAPLGHHIGQDVGHVSSTVLGASWHHGNQAFEASAFHGQEPEPTAVDLPMGPLDSAALRWIQEWNQNWTSMESVAYVKNPEGLAGIDHVYRSSASIYWDVQGPGAWRFVDSLIYGLIDNYDSSSSLSSFTEEFLFRHKDVDLWGRLEILQRTPAELAIANISLNEGQWMEALTLGATHNLWRWSATRLALGISLSGYAVPEDFKPAYGDAPWAAKIFLQLQGDGSWD